MKKRKIVGYVVLLVVAGVLLTGCLKEKIETNYERSNNVPKTSKEVVEKVVEKYKSIKLSNIKLSAKGNIKVKSNSKNELKYNISLQSDFNNGNVNNSVSKFTLNTKMGKLECDSIVYFLKNGAIGYSLNGKDVYDMADIAPMLGIVYDIPEAVKSDKKQDDDKKDIETQEPSSSAEVKKDYLVDNLITLTKYVRLRGNKVVYGKEAYVLKGTIGSVDIYNGISQIITPSLYNISTECGMMPYEIYVSKETYEILGVMLDCKDIIEQISGLNDVVENKINFKVSVNNGSNIAIPKVKNATINKSTQVWDMIGNYSKMGQALIK